MLPRRRCEVENKLLWFLWANHFAVILKACQPNFTTCHQNNSIQSIKSTLCCDLSFSPRRSMQHLSSSYTLALHPACLSGCLRALKVSTANSTWALNYLINLGWQDRLKPLCDPQASYTDISHWMGGRNLLPFFETLKCLTRFKANPQLYLYGSWSVICKRSLIDNWLTVEPTSSSLLATVESLVWTEVTPGVSPPYETNSWGFPLWL